MWEEAVYDIFHPRLPAATWTNPPPSSASNRASRYAQLHCIADCPSARKMLGVETFCMRNKLTVLATVKIFLHVQIVVAGRLFTDFPSSVRPFTCTIGTNRGIIGEGNRAGKVKDATHNLIEVLLRLRPRGACRRRPLLRRHGVMWWQSSTWRSVSYAHRPRRPRPGRGP